MTDIADASSSLPDEATLSAPARSRGLDVLRGCVALLVVAHHTAITYGGSGSWFYRELQPSAALSSRLLSLFCGFNQAWFMSLFFLLAGYFTPGAIDRHGRAWFARERLRRLGIPLLIFGFVLGPVAIALARTAQGQAFFPTLLSLWSRATFDLGPPWFCWALLLFSGVILTLWPLTLKADLARFPTNGALLIAAIGTGVVAFVLRLVWPVGVNVLGLQIGYFASYVLLFAFGSLVGRARLLSRIPSDQVKLWGLVALVAFPILPIASVAGQYVPSLSGSFNGGWNAPAIVYAF